jgi:hypothetical protein
MTVTKSPPVKIDVLNFVIAFNASQSYLSSREKLNYLLMNPLGAVVPLRKSWVI